MVRLTDDDPLIIKLHIENCIMSIMVVDRGSSADILLQEAFKMGLDRNNMRPIIHPLVSFNNDQMMPVGAIRLKVYAVERIIDVHFLVVDYHSTLKAIMGRT